MRPLNTNDVRANCEAGSDAAHKNEERTTYNVYCDESCVTSSLADDFMAIGGIMCPLDQKRDIVRTVDRLRAYYNVQGEFGWKTVCPSRLSFFQALVDLFFSNPELRFRAVVVSRRETNFDDTEEMFQKVYYQVFNNWLDRRDSYRLFIDRRIDERDRVDTLRRCLIDTFQFGNSVKFVEEVESHENDLIQLADLFIGALAASRNGHLQLEGSSAAKLQICRDICRNLNTSTLASYETWPSEQKFNVFHFRGRRNM